MRLTKPDPQIDIGTSTFAEGKDWLERKAFGEKLSRLVGALDSPTVIALDGDWGSGKSHFLKLWVGAHKHQFKGQAEVVYFDAFKEDFLDDPLVSLVAAIAPVTELEGGELEGKLAKAGKTLRRLALPLAKGGARIGLEAATYGATAALEGVWNDVAKAAGSEAAKGVDAIDALWAQEFTKRAAMEAFQQTLQTLVAPEGDDAKANKLVIIIDELDRCRPDYALSLLETIKHFFAVDGVHFVLGVNLSELENSVKARYGAGCDARTYLQKFVGLSVSLPAVPPSENSLNGTALEYFERTCVELGLRPVFTEMAQVWLKGLQQGQSVTLRQAERIASRLVLMVTDGRWGRDDRTAFLICLHILHVVSPNLLKELKQTPVRAGYFEDICNLFGLQEHRGIDVSGDKRDSKLGYHLWLAALGQVFLPDQREFIQENLYIQISSAVRMMQQLVHEHIDTWSLSS